MSEILFRTMFVLGIIAMIAVLIFAENGPSQPFNPVFPTLDTPFSITNYTYSWTPAERSGEFIDGSATATWVGCSDSPFDRNNCLNTKDGNVSYVEITIPTRIGDFANFTYNWSDISSRSVDGAEITSISITLQCRTTTIGTANLPMTYIANWLGVIPFGRFLPCPISDSFQNVTTTDTFNGTLNDPLPTLQSDGYIYDAALILPSSGGISSGDLLLTTICVRSTNTLTDTPTRFGIDIPGWSLLGDIAVGGGNPRIRMWGKIANSTEFTNYTITSSSSEDIVFQSFRVIGHRGTLTSTTISFAGSATGDPPFNNPSGWDIENTLWVIGLCMIRCLHLQVIRLLLHLRDIQLLEVIFSILPVVIGAERQHKGIMQSILKILEYSRLLLPLLLPLLIH